MTVEEFINVLDTGTWGFLVTLNYCGTKDLEEYTRVFFGVFNTIDGYDIPQKYKGCKILAIRLPRQEEIEMDIYDD